VPAPKASRRFPLAAVIAFVLSAIVSIGLVRAHDPPGRFHKYLDAAEASPDWLAARLLDLSPGYLAVCRAVVAVLGRDRLLLVQCLTTALAAALVASAVQVLAGRWWALVSGIVAATYRPLIVHAGIDEPEALIATLLALAMALGIGARARLRARKASTPWLLMLAAGLAIGATATMRPQYVLLIPVWAAWIAAASSRRWIVAVLVLVAGAAVFAPVIVSRAGGGSGMMVMNPGPVFYEGNGPGATGLTRHAPPVVQVLEAARPQDVDYGHVAYRRLASHALGRELSVREANQYWTALALQSVMERPDIAFARLVRKTMFSLMPREAHDLVVAEHLDRLARRLLPWGFGLLVVALPWIGLVRRSVLADLAGPLAIALLAVAVQIVFYASARQRLPLATAFLVIAPVVAAEVGAGRLAGGVRRSVAILLGLAFGALMAFLGGGTAAADQLLWQESRAAAAGEESRLAQLFQGRALRRGREEDQVRLLAAVQHLGAGEIDAGIERLEPLLGRRLDLTLDDRVIGVPEYVSARLELARGRRDDAFLAARAAVAIRPGDIRISALAYRLEDGAGDEWMPVGWDPVSVRWALAEAAVADRDNAEARRRLQPLAQSFPELAAAAPR